MMKQESVAEIFDQCPQDVATQESRDFGSDREKTTGCVEQPEYGRQIKHGWQEVMDARKPVE
jgi:hypothetical protein